MRYHRRSLRSVSAPAPKAACTVHRATGGVSRPSSCTLDDSALKNCVYFCLLIFFFNIILTSGLCILASTGVSLQKVVPLGIHTNVNTYAAVSYWPCFVFFCRRFLAFLYHPFPFSIVRRSLSSSSVCLFVVVYFIVRASTTPYVPCSEYGLVPVLSISCSISFRACSIQILFFSFCGCPFFSISSGMVI